MTQPIVAVACKGRNLGRALYHSNDDVEATRRTRARGERIENRNPARLQMLDVGSDEIDGLRWALDALCGLKPDQRVGLSARGAAAAGMATGLRRVK